MTSRKRVSHLLRSVLWAGLGLWAVGLVVFSLSRPARAAPKPGETMLRAGTSVRTMDGGTLPLLPRDSAVVVLAATSECAACRVGVPVYREVALRLRAGGVAFRAIVGSDSLAARQYSRLLPEPGTVVWDPGQKVFRSIGVRSVPSLYLVGRDGRLLKTWSPVPADRGAAEAIASEARAAR